MGANGLFEFGALLLMSHLCHDLVREVEGVPAFVVRLLDTILAQTINTASTGQRAGSNDNMEIN